jgi:hypothetical protein
VQRRHLSYCIDQHSPEILVLGVCLSDCVFYFSHHGAVVLCGDTIDNKDGSHNSIMLKILRFLSLAQASAYLTFNVISVKIDSRVISEDPYLLRSIFEP